MRFNDERKMLSAFLQYMQDMQFDLVSGWNSSKFDLLYIIRRMNNLAIDFMKLKSIIVAGKATTEQLNSRKANR